MRRRVLCILLVTILAGCARHILSPPHADAPWRGTSTNDYIDLRPGWRVRVTSPVLRAGAHGVSVTAQQRSGSTITMTAGSELEGYAVAIYSVEPRPSGGVSIKFVSEDVTKDGKTVRFLRPLNRSLFALPGRMHCVRLVFLTRLSRVNYDMALLAAVSPKALEDLTAATLNAPDACVRTRDSICLWIPEGTAVVPQMRRDLGGSESWAPVR